MLGMDLLQILLLPLLVAAVLFFFIFDYSSDARGTTKHLNLPLGSLSRLPLIGDAVSFYKPHYSPSVNPFLHQRFRRYGSIFKISLLGEPTIVSVDREFNRFVLQSEPTAFVSSYPRSVTGVLGEWSIGFLTGDVHQTLRSNLNSLVHGAKLRTRVLPVADREASLVLDSWAKNPSSLSAVEECKKFSFNVIAKYALNTGTADEEFLRMLVAEMGTFIDGMAALPLDLPGTSYRRALKARSSILKLLKKKLEETNEDENVEAREGFYSILAKKTNLTTDQVLEILMGLLFVGHSTVVDALSLALYFLNLCPEADRQLQEEHSAILEAKRQRGETTLTWHDYKQMDFTLCVGEHRTDGIPKGHPRRTLQGYRHPKRMAGHTGYRVNRHHSFRLRGPPGIQPMAMEETLLLTATENLDVFGVAVGENQGWNSVIDNRHLESRHTVQHRCFVKQFVDYMNASKPRAPHLELLQKSAFCRIVNINTIEINHFVLDQIVQRYVGDGKFRFCDKIIHFSAQDVGLILGLPKSGIPMTIGRARFKWDSYLARSVFTKDVPLNRATLLSVLRSYYDADDDDSVYMYVSCLICLMFCTFLFPETNFCFSRVLLNYVDSIEDTRFFNWSLAVSNHVLSNMDGVLKKMKLRSSSADGKVFVGYLSGCVACLYVWAFEHCFPLRSLNEDLLPRIRKWASPCSIGVHDFVNLQDSQVLSVLKHKSKELVFVDGTASSFDYVKFIRGGISARSIVVPCEDVQVPVGKISRKSKKKEKKEEACSQAKGSNSSPPEVSEQEIQALYARIEYLENSVKSKADVSDVHSLRSLYESCLQENAKLKDEVEVLRSDQNSRISGVVDELWCEMNTLLKSRLEEEISILKSSVQEEISMVRKEFEGEIESLKKSFELKIESLKRDFCTGNSPKTGDERTEMNENVAPDTSVPSFSLGLTQDDIDRRNSVNFGAPGVGHVEDDSADAGLDGDCLDEGKDVKTYVRDKVRGKTTVDPSSMTRRVKERRSVAANARGVQRRTKCCAKRRKVARGEISVVDIVDEDMDTLGHEPGRTAVIDSQIPPEPWKIDSYCGIGLLNDNEKRVIELFLSEPSVNLQMVFRSPGAYICYGRSLYELVCGQLVADELIEVYVDMVLNKYSSKPEEAPFFMPSIITMQKVTSTVEDADGEEAALCHSLFDISVERFAFLKRVFVVICTNKHWHMVVCDITQQKFFLLNSLSTYSTRCRSEALRWVEWVKAIFYNHVPGGLDHWKVLLTRNLPKQPEDSIDCAVFVCKYIESLCEFRKPKFDIKDMPKFRSQLAYEILTLNGFGS